jgi:Na+-translocating ferredoxin:NAD+ oxidoreductase RnfD subunit
MCINRFCVHIGNTYPVMVINKTSIVVLVSRRSLRFLKENVCLFPNLIKRHNGSTLYKSVCLYCHWNGLYKIELGRLPLTPALPVMGSLIVLVNKRADWNVPVSYIKYLSSCSACGFSTKKPIFKKPFLYFNILSIIWQLLLSVKWRHKFSYEDLK